MTDQLVPFLIASIGLTLSPGPDILYVLTLSITGSRSKAVLFATGLVTGIIFHTALVAFGIAALIKNNDLIFDIIKYLGAAYLVYLAVQVYRSDAGFETNKEKTDTKRSLFSTFKKGILMNVLNPKVSLFFLAFLPGFIWDADGLGSIVHATSLADIFRGCSIRFIDQFEQNKRLCFHSEMVTDAHIDRHRGLFAYRIVTA